MLLCNVIVVHKIVGHVLVKLVMHILMGFICLIMQNVCNAQFNVLRVMMGKHVRNVHLDMLILFWKVELL